MGRFVSSIPLQNPVGKFYTPGKPLDPTRTALKATPPAEDRHVKSPQTITDGQRAYAAKRAAKNGMSSDKYL